MTMSCFGCRVEVPAVNEVCPIVQQVVEAAYREVGAVFQDVLVGQLVETDHHDEFRRVLRMECECKQKNRTEEEAAVFHFDLIRRFEEEKLNSGSNQRKIDEKFKQLFDAMMR